MIRFTLRAHVLASLLVVACSPGASGDATTRLTSDAPTTARTDSVDRARQDSVNRAQPGYIVDSILPVEEEVRRFRAAVGGNPAVALAGGASSADELIARFATAVTTRDSVALRALGISPREFIDLVYPSSPYIRQPYRQAPGLLWSQIQLPSGTGFGRVLERLGSRPLRVAAVRCRGKAERQGENLLHANCTVRFASGDDPLREGRLFGTILERRGRFKFVSFANMY